MTTLIEQQEAIRMRGVEQADFIDIVNERNNYWDVSTFAGVNEHRRAFLPQHIKQQYLYTHRIILGVPCKTNRDKRKYEYSSQVIRTTKARYRMDDKRYCTLLPGFIPMAPTVSNQNSVAIGCSCLSLVYTGPPTGPNVFRDPLYPHLLVVRAVEGAAQHGCKHIIAYNTHKEHM
jgi:hypothetical protein